MSPWESVSGDVIWQGDLLRDCPVPVVRDDFWESIATGESGCIDVKDLDVIVATNTCDLVTHAVRMAVAVSVWSDAAFKEANPGLASRSKWGHVQAGRVNGLFLLPPIGKDTELVADFRDLHSLPHKLLREQAKRLGLRMRLASPYRERFSQQLGLHFSRVATP